MTTRIAAEFHIAVGHVAARIVELAARKQVGILVLGHGGHGMADRLDPTSVSHCVTSKATCPVVVVR